MEVAELEATGGIARQLSPISFEVYDPAGCYAWLLGLGGTPLQPRGPHEYGRVRTAKGGLYICYTSGLLIALGPEELATIGGRP